MEPENDGLDDNFPNFNWVIVWFHVNLPGCMIISNTVLDKSISRSILVAGHYICILVYYLFFFLNCF